jgi:hypothetical protein
MVWVVEKKVGALGRTRAVRWIELLAAAEVAATLKSVASRRVSSEVSLDHRWDEQLRTFTLLRPATELDTHFSLHLLYFPF